VTSSSTAFSLDLELRSKWQMLKNLEVGVPVHRAAEGYANSLLLCDRSWQRITVLCTRISVVNLLVKLTPIWRHVLPPTLSINLCICVLKHDRHGGQRLHPCVKPTHPLLFHAENAASPRGTYLVLYSIRTCVRVSCCRFLLCSALQSRSDGSPSTHAYRQLE
jgi:hypothetical protein